MRTVAGGSRYKLWPEIKPAVLGVPIAVPAVRAAGCFGAALLAGMARGLFASADAAWQSAYKVADVVFAEPEAVAFFRDLFARCYEPLRHTWDSACREDPA